MGVIRPVFVDGPYAGLDYPVPEEQVAGRGTVLVQPVGKRAALYYLRVFGLTCSGERVEFWVASVMRLDPPAGALVEYLFTEAARRARILPGAQDGPGPYDVENTTSQEGA